MNNIWQIISLTTPVFAMLVFGMILKKADIIDAHFISCASNILFKLTLPVTVGMALIKADLQNSINYYVIIYFTIATFILFGFIWIYSILFVEKKHRGVYVQGAFRGNNGTIGLALASSIYGDHGLSLGAALAVIVILTYNILSIFILSIYSDRAKIEPIQITKNIITNPMIISTLVALPISYFQIRLPSWLMKTGNYLGQMTLPLAVMCIGGSLSIASLKGSSSLALSASILRTIIVPFIGTLFAILLGFRKIDLAVLFLYFGSPAATVSFIMTKIIGGDEKLSANIVVITSFMVIITNNLGIWILNYLGFM